MKSRFTLPLLLLTLVGCGSRSDILAPSPSAQSAEEASLQGELALHPELLDEEFSTATDPITLEQAEGSGAGPAAAIHPLFYWREIRRVERAFEFAFSDSDSTGRPTRALVTVHRFLHGNFHVVARPADGSGEPGEGRTVTKPLHDHWMRRLVLHRVEGAEGRFRPWRIAATSGVRITSREATSRIRSLRIQSGDLDTTLTDALDLFRLRRVLRFEPMAEVRLTVTTPTEDGVVVLHVRDRRMRLANQGGGVYSGVFTAPEGMGLHHLAVNALTHGTLFDDEAPYDSQSWIIPYLTPPGELAELAP